LRKGGHDAAGSADLDLSLTCRRNPI
jgi:hypothetical protein